MSSVPVSKSKAVCNIVAVVVIIGIVVVGVVVTIKVEVVNVVVVERYRTISIVITTPRNDRQRNDEYVDSLQWIDNMDDDDGAVVVVVPVVV